MNVNAGNVKHLAESVERENWQFRAWLKGLCDLPEQQIDRMVAEATDKIWASFDCTTCANCCKELDKNVTADQIQQMAEALDISQQEFHRRYIKCKAEPGDIDEEELGDQWVMPGKPCPMLKDNKCSVYDARPRQCREYPYLYQAEFSRRTMGMIERTLTCPIVYQVMEQLKSLLPQWRHAPRPDWCVPPADEAPEGPGPDSPDLDAVLEEIDAEIRANEQKETVRGMLGDDAFLYDSDELPPEIREQFWKNVQKAEGQEWVSTRQWLTEDGVELPAPEELDDRQLSAKLWEVIHAMARRRTFLYHTDHLSDRELYEDLWYESLNEGMPDMGFSPDGEYVIDMIGGCSEEDIRINLKYYADDSEREQWARDWPEDDIPPRVTPPYRRDQRLPKGDLD